MGCRETISAISAEAHCAAAFVAAIAGVGGGVLRPPLGKGESLSRELISGTYNHTVLGLATVLRLETISVPCNGSAARWRRFRPARLFFRQL